VFQRDRLLAGLATARGDYTIGCEYLDASTEAIVDERLQRSERALLLTRTIHAASLASSR
jgi:hypothetical protein